MSLHGRLAMTEDCGIACLMTEATAKCHDKRNGLGLELACLIGKVIHGKIELVWYDSAWLLGPHHELIVLALPEAALVAVVLLVAAMELHELARPLVDVCGVANQLRHKRVPEEVAVFLQQLHLGPEVGARS